MVCGLSLEELHLPATAASGDLDLTFGNGGKVTTMAGSLREPGNGVAVQADGKIVVAGVFGTPSDYDFGVARFNANGGMDGSFGYKGKVTTHVSSTADYCLSVAVQEDGKIVAAGYSHNGSNYDFALVRYNADGTLDTSFGNGGKVTTGIGSNDYGQSVAVQTDGKIVVAGYSSNGNNNDFALARYNANGTLDTSFGTDGKVTTGIGDFNDYGHQVIVQGDGKLLVAGYCNGATTDDFALARYNADGTLDTSFGRGGKVMTDLGQRHDYGRGVAVQTDGRILVAGYTQFGASQDFGLVRYRPDGTLDLSFGSGGKVMSDIGNGTTDYGYSVALQANGQIVVAGRSLNANKNFDFAVARYNADGTLDTDFGNGGKTTTAVVVGPNYGYGVALQSSGKIVVAGYSHNISTGGYNFAVVRYQSTSVSPEVTTGQTQATTTSAHLWGMVNPNASETTVFFEVAKAGEPYGTLDTVAAHQSPLNGVTLQSVSGTKTGLLPHTAYKFRVKATSRAGTSVGSDVTFTTANTPPVANSKSVHPSGSGTTQTIFSPVTDASDGDGDPLTVSVVSYSGTGIVQVLNGVVAYSAGPLDGKETVTVEVNDGFGGTAQATIILSNTAPVVTGETVNASYGRGVTIPVLANDSDADGDPLSVISFTQPSHGEVVRAEKNPNALIYVPQLGFSGVDTFTYEVSDDRATPVVGTVEITVGPQPRPVTALSLRKGAAVVGAGDPKGGIPIGAIWNSFGVPAINDAGRVAVLSTWKSPAGSSSGIMLDQQLVVKSGDPVPGFPSLNFKSFTDPVLNAAGRVAFLATITGPGVRKGNDTVVVTNALSGLLQVVAREGGTAPETGEAIFSKFYSISLQGGIGENAGLLFTAALLSRSGSQKVTPANDLGAWLYTASVRPSIRKVVREGDPGFAEGETIKSFRLLQGVSGSADQSRDHYNAGEASFVVTLSSRREALVRFRGGALKAEALTGEILGEALPGARWKRFGVPATSGNGAVSAVRATLQGGLEGVTKANATGIFLSPGGGGAFVPVARLGDEAFGIPGAVFTGFNDPLVSGFNAGVAFVGSIRGSGVLTTNNTGIWWQTLDGTGVVARTGTQAAEAPEGALWKSFRSLALTDGERGPLFVGTLKPGAGPVDTNNDVGLWAVDSLGEVRLLVREQDTVGGKTLKSFSALGAVSASNGVRRSFNNSGQVAFHAYFTDGSQGVVRVQVP